MDTRASAFLIDILVIFIFAVLARPARNTPEDPLTFISILDTWWLFALGALLSTVPIKNESNPRIVGAGTIVWLGTAVVGLAMWTTRNPTAPHWSFVLVTSIISALLPLGWRAASNAIARESLDQPFGLVPNLSV